MRYSQRLRPNGTSRINPPISDQMNQFLRTMKSVFTHGMRKKGFCCSGFERSIAAAGGRGLAVLVHKGPDGIGFVFQSRGVAFEDESKIRSNPSSPDIKINVSWESGLHYCPYCGRRLGTLVKASPQVFYQLAEKHKQLLPGVFKLMK